MFAYTKIMQALAAAGVVPAATDPYFNLTTLLLNTSSTNGAQNNTFLDSSTNNFTITRNGNTTQGTFTPFSQTGWSNYFNGSNSYINIASNAAFALGTGDFTIEFWFYTSTATGQRNISFPTVGAPIFYMNSSGGLTFEVYGASPSIATTNALTLNAWNHCAVCRVSGTVNVYINGVSGITSTAFSSTNFIQSAINIGTDAGSNFTTGYMSNVRIVKGTGVYTGNFTPSTTPLTAISGTSLLTCQSNRFLDNSPNAFTFTANNFPSVQAFSPFLPTAAYDTAVVGGSGYFDGSGDYLTAPNNTAFDITQGDFLIEAWVYRSVTGAEHNILGQRNAGTGWLWRINSTNTVTFGYISGTTVTSTGTIAANTWTYLAVSRVGSNMRIFINGTIDGSSSAAANGTTASATLNVGADSTPTNYMNGYLSSIRLVKGSGVSSISVPTAPANPTGTNICLNFTNAGIYDSASKNVLETVGNAQVSTTQSKWGTTAIYFDGTGDYLTIPNSPTLAVGSGDFTIEGWWYPTDLSGTTHLWCLGDERSTYNGLLLYWSAGTSKLTLYSNGSAIITSSISTSTNTWYFVSVVRSGTTITLYVNGSSAGTVTNSTSFTGIAANGFCLNAEYAGSFAAGKAAYYDDFRITKGYARPSTSPTAAFPLQ